MILREINRDNSKIVKDVAMNFSQINKVVYFLQMNAHVNSQATSRFTIITKCEQSFPCIMFTKP